MLTDSELRKVATFKNIKSALEKPDEVYKLSFRVSNSPGIKTFPLELKQFKNLQYLDCSQCNRLKEIPDWIGESENLQVLILSETSFATLPKAISKLVNLHTLDVSFNSDLRTGIEHIYNLPKLKTLKFDCNTPISADLKNLTGLENLLINGLSEKENFEFIYGLQALKKLEIVGDNLSNLPVGISSMKSLEEFIFLCSPLEKLPADFCDLPKLKIFTFSGLYNVYLYNHNNPNFELNIKWNQIFESLAKIKTLQSVNLSSNCIKKYDPNIGLLTQIKKMNLNDLVRKTIENPYPKEFLKLINLKELTVSDQDSEFSTIKEIGTTLPNLKVLKK